MAIARTATSAVQTGSGTGARTLSFDCAGANLLIFGAKLQDTSTTVSSITYNGVSLTINPGGGNAYAQSGGASVRVTLFYLFNPSSGSNTFSWTPSASVSDEWQLSAYSDADTTDYETYLVDGNTGSASSRNVSPTVAGAWAIGVISLGTGTTSDSTNYDFLGAGAFGLFDSGASLGPAGTYGVALNQSGGANWSAHIFSWGPAPVPPLTVNFDGTDETRGMLRGAKKIGP